MRTISVRFGETAFQWVREEAELEDLSLGRFIAEAAMARALVNKARRGEFPPEQGKALRDAVTAFVDAAESQRRSSSS